MGQLKITQTKGLVGTRANQQASMRTLGLRRIRQSVVRPDTPDVRGLVNVVRHLVTVEEVN
ncbi:50S ribosomal protein L30 [Allosaccharopolyspora coralli]|uniref:Large ribosomal subunit protein uL30 n=1 Tax=Allosaccharopolyspora coralli TaxID=2665642 RepID=A0A5Q3QAK5_9PSEU|nr:50S ribosomal protein L30 [Allosaccharopolyspora coralli]QGK71512.1 50S ribosomal protein L30 [Allosaccharopolyspora coralli]